MSDDAIRILWLDDEIYNFLPYVQKLEELKFNVDTATSYKEAWYNIHDNQYDIIIVDILMPPPDGIDFIEAASEKQDHVTFVVFSAYLHDSNYRHRLHNLCTPVTLIEKCFVKGPGEPVIASNFIQPLLDAVNHKEEKQGAIQKILDAIDLQPGWAGISIDIKKLLSK